MTQRPVGRPKKREFHRRALIIAATLLIVPTALAAAEDWTGYAARPAPGDGNRDSGRFELSIPAGASATDAIEIFNLTDSPAAFDVYAADVVETTAGGRAPASRDVAVSGAATWIQISRAVVDLEPRSSTLVEFIVAVPAATTNGPHTAAILIEPRGSDGSGTITSRTRVGLWVEIAVLEGSDAPPGQAAGVNLPWLPLAGLVVIGCFGMLLYVTRERWHRWFEERREERALLRDFRNRRRQRSVAAHGRRG